MNNPLLIAIIVGVVAGILLGSRVAARSLTESPIYGGSNAKGFHWLACAAFAGGLPAGLTDIILGRNVLMGFVLALCFIGVSFASLLLYGLLERGPRAAAEAKDRGWTAEKARTSGL